MAVSHSAPSLAHIRAFSHHCQPGDLALVTGASAGMCHLGRQVEVVRRATVLDITSAAWCTTWVVENDSGLTFLCADAALTPLMPADGDVLACRLPHTPLIFAFSTAAPIAA